MLVSVVIPWHRNILDLRTAVGSVLEQNWDGLDLIVVANGVDDDDYAAARSVSADPRLRVVRLGQAGAAPARNHGMDLARGELIFFLDADDTFLPDKIVSFVSAYRAERFDIAFSRGLRDRGNGLEWPMPPTLWDKGMPLAEFFFVVPGNISTSALVVSRTAAGRLRFNENASPYEDPDIVLMAEHLGMTVRMLPESLYRWSDHRSEGRLSRAMNLDQRLAWIEDLPATVSHRARAAFRARCVAQHVFPQRFALSMRLFAAAALCRAVPLSEILLFVLRGLLPAGLRRRMLDLYLARKAKMGTAAS